MCLALLLLTGACSCSHFGAAYGKISKEQEAGEGRSLSLSIHLDEISYVKAGEVIPAAWLDLNEPEKYFQIAGISDEVYQEINGKSYRENDHIGLENLRYLKVLHYNYDHEIQVGELIVNRRIAEDCRKIFLELFQKEYEIASMRLIDKFWVGNGVDSDTNSIEHNNTSAFNYRVVPGTDHLSNHARGYAIDLNPIENPYVQYNAAGEITNHYKDMEKYLDRDAGLPHMITHEDQAYKVFSSYGFTWGGDWVSSKDYQHFEKKDF